MSRRYCVLGGGISGLVAAHRIRAAAGEDAEIVILDPADRLGGVLRTEHLGGAPMDVGAEAFVARRPEVGALLAELGIADKQITTTGVRPTIYSQDRLHPLPAGAVNGIPGTAESVAGLVDRTCVAMIAAEAGRPLAWRTGDDPSVGHLVAERFGEQVVTRSVDPMLSGVYAGSAATIGLRSAVPTVAAALDAGADSLTAAVRRALPPSTAGPVFAAVAGGYQVLLDALVAAGRPHWVQAPATAIAPDGPGWAVTDGTGHTWHADAVVLALPAPQAAALLASVAGDAVAGDAVAPDAAAAAGSVATASAVVLAMALPAGTPFPPQSGVLVATGESLHAKAITLTSRKWGARGSDELLRMSFGRFGDDIARTTSEADLTAWALADLQAVFGITAHPRAVQVHRWIDALPQYGPGHGDVAARIRAGLPPTLAVAGNYLDGVGVPACVAAAGRAAAGVLAATAG